MSKRAKPDVANNQLTSKELKLYQKSYKGGGPNDHHYAVFRKAQQWTKAKTVLYPGCHRHLTAAMIFEDVTFVDYDAKVSPLYSDAAARSFVDAHKIYKTNSSYRFYCYNVDIDTAMPLIQNKTFDLLISLSAGLLAEPCTKYVSKPGGYLLVNDAHSDARTVFANDNNWELVAYFNDAANVFTAEGLEKCFQVKQKSTRGRKIVDEETSSTSLLTKEQAEESVRIGTKRKRSFQLLFEPMFYLFQLK